MYTYNYVYVYNIDFGGKNQDFLSISILFNFSGE